MVPSRAPQEKMFYLPMFLCNIVQLKTAPHLIKTPLLARTEFTRFQVENKVTNKQSKRVNKDESNGCRKQN